MMDSLQECLQTPASWEDVNRLSKEVFYEGNLDKCDELFYHVIPIINMSYYKFIPQYDDRGYAREDLLQDAMLEIYRDITLRWDKFIDVDDHYNYFKILCRNVMLALVQPYHNYYLNTELDPDVRYRAPEEFKCNSVDAQLHKDYLQRSILDLTRRLIKNRTGYVKILDYVINWKYVDNNPDIAALKVKLKKIVYKSKSEIDFMIQHVEYVHRFSYNYYLAKERHEDKMVKRLDRIINRFEDSTYEVLSKNYGNTILPEVYAEFGPELTKKFVKLFSGKQIKVPDYTEFCDDMVGGSLLSLVSDKDDLYKISTEFDLNYKTLSRIYNRALEVRGLNKK